MLISKLGKAIIFHEEDVRGMGRNAVGVRGINLDKGDEVVSMVLLQNEDQTVLVMTTRGYGKRTKLSDYRVQTRGGKGIYTFDKNKIRKTGPLLGAVLVDTSDEIMLINSDNVIIRIRAKDVSRSGRTTQGVKIMKVNKGQEIVAFAKVLEDLEHAKRIREKKEGDNVKRSGESK